MFFLIAISCLFGMSASVEEFDPLIEKVEENNSEETKRIEEMFGGTLKWKLMDNIVICSRFFRN